MYQALKGKVSPDSAVPSDNTHNSVVVHPPATLHLVEKFFEQTVKNLFPTPKKNFSMTPALSTNVYKDAPVVRKIYPNDRGIIKQVEYDRDVIKNVWCQFARDDRVMPYQLSELARIIDHD